MRDEHVDLEGKKAVVVGGASGMARATATSLVTGGAAVAILDRPQSKGAEVASELGNGTTFHPCDVTDAAKTEEALSAAVDALGTIHIAVNTAGGGMSKRTVSKDGPMDLTFFSDIVELNLIATFNLNRLQAWQMSKNDPDAEGERGVIVNTASIAAFEGQIGQVAYSAAKGGLVGMTLTMARDLGSLGIRVLTIAPSLFLTGLTDGIPDDMAQGLVRHAAFPRRPGRPDEYAKLALAIIGNPMLNGTTFRLDGGTRFTPK
jgi:NAD(P)-dependent dehydrogenase (short-subunit alcohol dehydrogenase family)